MRVRVVDDTAEIALWLKQSIGILSPDVEIITTTGQFERLLDPGPWMDIDVAVLDVMLPGLSGLDIARFLREVVPRVRIVVMTASLVSADEATGLADIVLVKPFSTESLLAAIGASE